MATSTCTFDRGGGAGLPGTSALDRARREPRTLHTRSLFRRDALLVYLSRGRGRHAASTSTSETDTKGVEFETPSPAGGRQSVGVPVAPGEGFTYRGRGAAPPKRGPSSEQDPLPSLA